MKWELRMSREAISSLYRLERSIATIITEALDRLAEDPTSATLQPDDEDPSRYWIAVDGDYSIWFEILDERHAIRIIDIE